jgi:hypothetical protein
MADVEGGFEVIYDDQSETTSTGGPWQPGQIVVHRSGTGRAQRALAKWMLIDNAGISQGEVAVSDFAATNSNTVAKASTTDGAAPHFRGIAAATIASNKYGFFFINGYVESADSSETVASGELMTMSGSTAGKLTGNRASSFWGATLGLSSTLGTAPFVFAIARGAFATGVGSVQILGTWG